MDYEVEVTGIATVLVRNANHVADAREKVWAYFQPRNLEMSDVRILGTELNMIAAAQVESYASQVIS